MAEEPPRTPPGGAAPGHFPTEPQTDARPTGEPTAHAASLLEALRTVATALARPAEVERLLRTIAEQGVALTGADSAAIALPEGRALRIRGATGALTAQEGVLVPLDAGFVGAAFRTATPQLVADLATDPRVYRARRRGLPAGAAVAVPLVSEGRAQAVLVLAAGDVPEARLRDGLGALLEVTGFFAAAVENVQRFGRARSSEEMLERWRTERWLRFWIRSYERIIALLGAVGFAWNARNDRMLWGGSLHAVLGYTPREFGLSLEAWAEHLVEDDRAVVLRQLRHAAAASSPAHVSARIRDADGLERAVGIRIVSAGPTAPGRMLGVLVEEGRAGTPATPTPEPARVVQLLQHEINNPLAVVMAQVQLLLLEAEVPEENRIPLRPTLESIWQHSQRISGVVRRIPELLSGLAAEVDEAAGSAARASEVEAEFRTILESLAEGVVVLDRSMAVRYSNPSAGAVLGSTPAALGGRVLPDVFAPLDVATRVRESISRAFRGTDQLLECRITPLTGGELWVQIDVHPLRSASEDVIGAAVTLVDVTDRRERERMIREAALLDPLTALPNRALLADRIAHAIARFRRHPEHRFGILFLDLDHLKWVNDSFGHAAGDELLTAVAGRLRACIRPEDTLARIGGDEFAILLESIHDSTDATRVCERILSELAKPLLLGEYELSASASIGIVLDASGTRSPDELIRDADAAMYRAKTLGGGRCEIFDRELQRMVSSRLEAEAELRRALERREFVLHYQPIVALGTRQVVGLEALLRWQHPQRGLLYPADFIGLAEGTNLILPIGEWVLGDACRQLQAWKEQHGERAPRWVALNLSGKQFLQPGLVARVREALRETGLRPDELRIEITESTVSQHSGVASTILADLQALGIRVNMDDFGTGYSSLGTLYQLPIEALKIDRSFVSDLRTEHGADHLVRTIVSVAQGVGAATIAEGVTTSEQLGELRRLGCQYGQGYLFSRPLAAAEVEPLLRANGAGATL